MTLRDIPIVSTIIVGGAIAVMIALGFWQLGRMDEKEALLARYEMAPRYSHLAPWPATEDEVEKFLYRQAIVNCEQVLERTTVAARSQSGASGLAQVVRCRVQGGAEATIQLGFTRRPEPIAWEGGAVFGTIAPGPRLVASKPVDGLEPLARPDPGDLPNNHLAYAGQWFFFALTALVIYILALRRRATRARDE